MKEFDKIIGYSSIKKELMMIADTLKNRDVYEKLGVSMPSGLLLHGEPGVGKTLMAKSLINASGLKCFVCRKDKPNGDFTKSIKETFEEASKNAPAIVFLDDMDKFSNEDKNRCDTEEYVTVQSCIDEFKEKKIFVLATVNDMRSLPRSLTRSGRFDTIIEVSIPEGNDALLIIEYYLKNKKLNSNFDVNVISKILEGHSCADLENVINQAGLFAGYERAKNITMDHFIEACLKTIFDVPYTSKDNCEDDWYSNLQDSNNFSSRLVYHEIGHALISEILIPGSVSLISAHNSQGTKRGFTSYYKDPDIDSIKWRKSRVISGLGGKAAIDYKFGIVDSGAQSDLDQAFQTMKDLVIFDCINGLSYHKVCFDNSNNLQERREQAVLTQVEQYYQKAKEIIALNIEFFEKLATELAKKKILHYKDIQKIKSECNIISFEI